MADRISDEDLDRIARAVGRGVWRGLRAMAVAGLAVVTIWLAPMLLMMGAGSPLGIVLAAALLVAIAAAWRLAIRPAP